MSTAATRLFWTKIHRWLGLSAMAFLFIAAVTGSLLCFDKQIDASLNGDLFTRQTTMPAMAPTLVADRIQRLRPDLVITEYRLADRPDRNVQLKVASASENAPIGFDELYVDPGNAAIVGTRQSGPGWGRRHIVEGVFQLHQNLVAGKWGRWIMGAAALAWLIGNCVGLYLTFPAKLPFWRKWWKKWKVDPHAKFRRMMLEIHNSSGLWLLIPATILAFTSVAMNFFDEIYEPAVSAISPSKHSIFDDPPPKAVNPPKVDFSRALEIASNAARQARLSGKPALERYFTQYGVYGVSFTGDGQITYKGLGPVVIYVSAEDGRVEEINNPYLDTVGRKLIRMLYPLHSGQVVGWFGVALIFLLGLSTAEMCVTGLYTWWRKRSSRRPRGEPGA